MTKDLTQKIDDLVRQFFEKFGRVPDRIWVDEKAMGKIEAEMHEFFTKSPMIFQIGGNSRHERQVIRFWDTPISIGMPVVPGTYSISLQHANVYEPFFKVIPFESEAGSPVPLDLTRDEWVRVVSWYRSVGYGSWNKQEDDELANKIAKSIGYRRGEEDGYDLGEELL